MQAFVVSASQFLTGSIVDTRHKNFSRDARYLACIDPEYLQLIKQLLLRPFPNTGFAIDLGLRQVLNAVVIRDDLGIVGNIQRFAVLVLAYRLRVGQRLCSISSRIAPPC
ncbi:MAG: hypothetical protein AAAB23_13645 [Pseudomonas sp.]